MICVVKVVVKNLMIHPLLVRMVSSRSRTPQPGKQLDLVGILVWAVVGKQLAVVGVVGKQLDLVGILVWAVPLVGILVQRLKSVLVPTRTHFSKQRRLKSE